jgi:hypothetical protein
MTLTAARTTMSKTQSEQVIDLIAQAIEAIANRKLASLGGQFNEPYNRNSYYSRHKRGLLTCHEVATVVAHIEKLPFASLNARERAIKGNEAIRQSAVIDARNGKLKDSAQKLALAAGLLELVCCVQPENRKAIGTPEQRFFEVIECRVKEQHGLAVVPTWVQKETGNRGTVRRWQSMEDYWGTPVFSPIK